MTCSRSAFRHNGVRTSGEAAELPAELPGAALLRQYARHIGHPHLQGPDVLLLPDGARHGVPLRQGGKSFGTAELNATFSEELWFLD